MSKIKRRIILPGRGGKPKKSPTSITIEQSHARQIYDLPPKRRERVIRFIREGIPTGRIASHFESEGLITVSAKSFAQYITAFKRVYADMIEQHETGSLDDLIDAIGPDLEEEDLLEQLIRLQKSRLSLAHTFEKNTRLLNPVLYKEVTATKDLIETLAKLRGKTQGAGRPEKDQLAIPSDAKDKLSSIDRSQEGQARLVGLLGRMADLVQKKQENAQITED